MSIEPIIVEVRRLLAQTNDSLQQAETALAQGTGEERVHAAGELVLLRRQQAELRARMGELRQAHDSVRSTMLQWIKEDWMILMLRMESWIEH
jgi:hypothetical protein